MVSIDANILIYAYDEDCVQYPQASKWLEQTLDSDMEIGLPFQSILAFIRISTNAKLLGKPLSVPDALDLIDSWLSQPNVRILSPGPDHWSIFSDLYIASSAGGKLSTDVHIAALALEHDATLYSADTDFARFPGLHWINPLANHA